MFKKLLAMFMRRQIKKGIRAARGPIDTHEERVKRAREIQAWILDQIDDPIYDKVLSALETLNAIGDKLDG